MGYLVDSLKILGQCFDTRLAGVDCEEGAGHPRVQSWRVHMIVATTAGWTKRNTTINLLDEEDEGEDVL